MSDRLAEYRRRAEECRIHALGARDPDIYKEYLELAEGWLRLALIVEQQQRRLREDKE
jgi:hypothetical protein